MSSVLGVMKSNSANVYLVLTAIWFGFSLYLGSYYALWPVVASGVAGALLKLRPGTRLTWSWATSACVLGLLLSTYIAYAAWPFTAGAFSTTAYVTLAGFAVLGVVHLIVLYLGTPGSKPVKSD